MTNRAPAGLTMLAALACAGAASGHTVPTKTITFYNNSNAFTLYPVLQAPIMSGANVHDLWLQAEFDVPNLATQVFNTTVLYKIFINPKDGVAPHHSVTLTMPFYTQILAAKKADYGTVPDQFIDWWNAMRVFVFNGDTAKTAAYNYGVSRTGQVVPPTVVKPIAGAAVPTCTSDTGACEPITIVSYVNGFPISVPAQLVEYTFAAANGPPLAPTLSIDRTIVNYNISGVDSIYLPAAIGASGNATADNTYLGSTQRLRPFLDELEAFTVDGTSWPYFVPAYYAPSAPIEPLTKPPPGYKRYPLPQIPSTNTVYAESFRDPPPAPPVLSSDTLDGIGRLGSVAQGTLDLWNTCVDDMSDSTTCREIRQVNRFFVDDYHECFGKDHQLPATEVFLRDVYGWVQFPGCPTPLSQAAGYKEAIVTYCDLQYNFFKADVPPDQIFNPYVQLVHQILQSNAYAFSIDDAVSFKSLPGTGVIVTVSGANGLEDTTQSPLPTATTYQRFCRN
jgi:hypothetical protein